MAKIESYELDNNISENDKVIGTDADDSNKTKNFLIKDLASYFGQAIGDVHEGYIETGTRDAAISPLKVAIGDYDSSNNGTFIEIDDDAGEINITGDLNVPVVNLNNSGNNGILNANSNTADRTYNLPDKSGTISLVEDIIVNRVKVTLTDVQVKTLFSSPTQIISAPGAGKVINVIDFVARLNFNTSAFDLPNSLKLRTTGGLGQQAEISQIFVNGVDTRVSKGTLLSSTDKQITENSPLEAYILTSDPTVGDGTVDLYITYEIITL